MARFARVVIADVPHHVTQRGNAQQSIFVSDTDRRTYLGLLGQYCRLQMVRPRIYLRCIRQASGNDIVDRRIEYQPDMCSGD